MTTAIFTVLAFLAGMVVNSIISSPSMSKAHQIMEDAVETHHSAKESLQEALQAREEALEARKDAKEILDEAGNTLRKAREEA